VFLPFVLAGEKVDASLFEQKRGFARGQAQTILQSSPHRIEPQCVYFLRCGGCHYQHTSYEHQLEIKADILKENLRRIAKLELQTEVKMHASPPWNYRNRSRLKIRTAPEFALGYYRFGSHDLLPVEQCPVSSPLINRAMATFWEMGRRSAVPDGIREVEFFADAEDKQLLMEAYCGHGVSSTPLREWAEAARQLLPEVAGVVVFKEGSSPEAPPKQIARAGAGEITYQAGANSYRVSAGSFFQVNRHLVEELIGVVSQGHSGKTALDLYAGVGLFSTALARSFAQVIAVEASQTGHADLVHNSPSNVKVVRATTGDYLRSATAGVQPELVVVDPPRSGLGESVVRSLAGLGAHRLFCISCDPATASRDLAGLLRHGYQIAQAHLVDLFPQTYHLETVFELVR